MERCPKCAGLKFVMVPVNHNEKNFNDSGFNYFSGLNQDKPPIDRFYTFTEGPMHETRPCKFCREKGFVTEEEAMDYERYEDIFKFFSNGGR